MITPLNLNNVQLRSGRILEKKSPSVVIQESEKEKIFEEEKSLNEKRKKLKNKLLQHIQITQLLLWNNFQYLF